MCGQAFATLGQLTKHEKQVHGADPELGPNSFPCQGCLITFHTKQGLADHKKRNNCFDMQASCYNYRVSQQVSDLGWVDLDLGGSTTLLGQ